MAWMEVKIEGVKEALELCSSKLVRDALKYTVRDLARTASIAAKDKIKEGYNIRPSDLNKAFKIKPGSDPLEATLEITDADKRGIPIFQLAGRVAVQTREGVWAEIRKGRAKAFTQGFIQTMRSGHKGVFIRYRGGSGKGGRMTRRDVGKGKQPPIHEIYGPRITSLVKDYVIQRTIEEAVKNNAQRIFNQKLAWKTGGLLGG